MNDTYFALLHPPGDHYAWGVAFPDLPGCTSMGDSFEEALVLAADALFGYLDVSTESDFPVPQPCLYAALMKDPDVQADIAEGAVLHLVTMKPID